MIVIPVQRVERQSLSMLLDNVLHQISVKECNGIMAVTVVRDSVTLIENRRAAANVPLIPAGPREYGNFIFSTMNDEMPYWAEFGKSQTFFYLTQAEMEVFRAG